MPHTVGDIASLFNIAPQTVRTWCKEFEDWLSPSARAPKGETRIFTEEDLYVFALVAEMRQGLAGYEDIKRALDAGQRGEVTLPAAEEEDMPPSTAAALAIRYEAQLAIRDGQLAYLEEDRDEWRRRYDAEHDARIEAERRAAHAEGRLEALEHRTGEAKSLREPPAPEGKQEVRRRGWWDWLRGR